MAVQRNRNSIAHLQQYKESVTSYGIVMRSPESADAMSIASAAAIAVYRIEHATSAAFQAIICLVPRKQLNVKFASYLLTAGFRVEIAREVLFVQESGEAVPREPFAPCRQCALASAPRRT